MKGGIRNHSLVASLAVSLFQPVVFGAVGAILVMATAGEARAQQSLNTEAIARIAQVITVRIEGATQGSGVLVKRDGNRYTVLTAWHVVSGQRPGEELVIYTPDGRSHALEAGSIRRVGEVDLAVLTFTSEITYQLARIGDTENISSGSSIFVSGFPLPTSSIPARLFRFRDGLLQANTQSLIPNGHDLLYTNQTLPGMSGGAVLNAKAELVGIHASAERADQLSESTGKAVATGTNQGVPIAYYRQSAAESSLSQTVGMWPVPNSPATESLQVEGIDADRAANTALYPSEEEIFITLTDPRPIDELCPFCRGQGMQQSITPSPTKGVVRLGDSLLLIAMRYRTTMQEILRLNPGLFTAPLVPGTEIQLVQAPPSSPHGPGH
jgi:LysM repeat protein